MPLSQGTKESEEPSFDASMGVPRDDMHPYMPEMQVAKHDAPDRNSNLIEESHRDTRNIEWHHDMSKTSGAALRRQGTGARENKPRDDSKPQRRLDFDVTENRVVNVGDNLDLQAQDLNGPGSSFENPSQSTPKDDFQDVSVDLFDSERMPGLESAMESTQVGSHFSEQEQMIEALQEAHDQWNQGGGCSPEF